MLDKNLLLLALREKGNEQKDHLAGTSLACVVVVALSVSLTQRLGEPVQDRKKKPQKTVSAVMSGKGGRGKISYVQQSEPSFIQAFKQRVGYKEGPSIDTKREELSLSDDDDKPEADDEKPVVVVLKSGDLTAEEAQRLQDEDEPPPDGKIKFRKPVKRNAEISSESAAKEIPGGDSKKRKKKKSTKEKSSSLLSFDEEENDDG